MKGIWEQYVTSNSIGDRQYCTQCLPQGGGRTAASSGLSCLIPLSFLTPGVRTQKNFRLFSKSHARTFRDIIRVFKILQVGHYVLACIVTMVIRNLLCSHAWQTFRLCYPGVNLPMDFRNSKKSIAPTHFEKHHPALY